MFAIDYKDQGTPEVSGAPVEVEVDGVKVTVPEGTSVMRAASLAGTQVPKLCATDTLKAFGSCRLCLVEIEGRKGYPASCTTTVAAGMKIRTESEKLLQLRRNVIELYLSENPHHSETCPASGHCELENMAEQLGVTESRYRADEVERAPATKDTSNPYFTFDPDLCIVCSRCVRACDEVQGTFALTIENRGIASRVSASQHESFLDSECVSCGACVESCPTGALFEKSLALLGKAEDAHQTTCGYCGVGCSFQAETRGTGDAVEVVRMTPSRNGHANSGHACVKGRFAYGYATHPDRVTQPLMRASIDDPWVATTWDEAIAHSAREFKRIQAKYGRDSVGGITSSRCTNEETFLVQKLVRAAFGNNNVDTCARVCHSPTGYGLKHTLGESAGTQAFTSVAKADVIMIIGANPSEAHPVFASRMKQRLRQGARLIVVDPRVIGMVHSPHIEANYHLQLRPGTNVGIINALAHVVVTEGLTKDNYIAERCEPESYQAWKKFVSEPRNSPEAMESITGVPAGTVRSAARLYAKAANGAIYYGLGVTEHSQGTTMVMGIANLAMATGNLGREGVGVSPLRGQNNVQGSCDMGSFPHEFSGYRHVSDEKTRHLFEQAWGVNLLGDPGLRIPNMFEAALDGSFKGMYVQGEDFAQSDPNTLHIASAMRELEFCVVQDLFLNETAKFAHVFLPGSSFLEKDGTFTNAERRISRVRKLVEPLAGLQDWEIT
ncbi:MAG TPA: molybdopterin-dependent oxidoreductase, partial [Steroidobacteraceae bacterium]